MFRLATAGGRLPLLAGWPRGVLTGAAVLIQPSVAAAAMLVRAGWRGGATVEQRMLLADADLVLL